MVEEDVADLHQHADCRCSRISRSGRFIPIGAGAPMMATRRCLLKRFGSVSVLNGHIHQVMQKVEGNVSFHTALSTAFPQPQPGKASGPGRSKMCRRIN